MTRINTNVSSLVAQKTLARSNSQLQTALTRLSTGLRINNGKDDPAGLIASEALKADIASTQRALSNSERANSVLGTADSGLSKISELLTDIRGLVTEAANTGAMSDDQIAANQLQVDSSLAAIDRIAQTTQFQGRKLLDGSLDFNVSPTAAGGLNTVRNLSVSMASLAENAELTVDVTIQSAAAQAELYGTITPNGNAAEAVLTFDPDGTGTDTLTIAATADGAAYNGFTVKFAEVNGLGTTPTVQVEGNEITIYVDDTAATALADIETAFTQPWVTGFTATAAGDGDGDIDPTSTDTAKTAVTAGGADEGPLVFEVRGNEGSHVFNFTDTSAVADIVAAINLQSDATGVTASTPAAGIIKFLSSGYGSKSFVAVDVHTDAGGFGNSLRNQQVAAGSTFMTRQTGVDIVAFVDGSAATGDGNTLSLSTATLQMSATVDDGDNTNFSFEITGGGALFQLGPKVQTSQQARIGIQSVNTASLGGVTGRLYQLGSGQTAALATDAALAGQIVDESVTKVTNLRGRLGAFQKATVDSNIAALNDGLQNLTDAQSRIADADFATESANLTRAQILVQSGTAVLSIANQNPQNVLRLLQ